MVTLTNLEESMPARCPTAESPELDKEANDNEDANNNEDDDSSGDNEAGGEKPFFDNKEHLFDPSADNQLM